MPRFSILFFTGLLTIPVLLPLHAMAHENVPSQEGSAETEPMGEQVREIGQEMTRVFIQKLQEFLDAELQRLRESTPKTRKELQTQLDQIESQLKAHPNDAPAHMEVGEVYDRLGDGANAIIHMKKAESLEKSRGNVKGLAEARRNLRRYFSKYDFKPEDFDLGD
ncbi:MAG: hypothetical protein G3M70_00445 [Candidatus Nitronauta litoralis]|uniref:Uncharacterized protein n=1 Tax=Candidatus Nitronauta litoralis TaxID=2705533 RepID=A0A7T0BSZ2_9BACT|nr:MAG: hypothetical protein G3M70_00445 [Candidatus Nitronauta litoralis]